MFKQVNPKKAVSMLSSTLPLLSGERTGSQSELEELNSGQCSLNANLGIKRV
jgi:hypothetical protein